MTTGNVFLAGLIGGISHKVLTHTLRRLESNGLVARHAYTEAPPRPVPVVTTGSSGL